MYPMLMAGVSCTQSSRFFRRRVGAPFAASHSYFCLSSFSAKFLVFEIHPVVSATLEPRPSSRSIGYRPSLSVLSLRFCHASFLINPWSQLVATGRNWLPPMPPRDPFCHFLPPKASMRLQGPPFSRPSRCQSATVLSSVLSLRFRLASSLSRIRLRRYSIPRYPQSSDSTRFFYLRLRPYHYPLHTDSIPSVQHSQRNLLLRPCSCILCPRPPSSPR